MARKYHTYVREEKAVEICVDIQGMDKYQSAWLWLHNNAREYPKSIYKVTNNSKDSIFILCNPDTADRLKSIVEDWGEVKWVHDKMAVFVDVSCDWGDFDKDYVDFEYVLGEED